LLPSIKPRNSGSGFFLKVSVNNYFDALPLPAISSIFQNFCLFSCSFCLLLSPSPGRPKLQIHKEAKQIDNALQPTHGLKAQTQKMFSGLMLH
jgi:hypothetical protein